MKRDTIFYRLFQQLPSLLFDLLENPPENALDYRFDSVAVKEPKFEIDGVFLPPNNDGSGVVFFCEVQFQKDERLYERLFSEIFLYFYRNRERYSDWQAVVIYPDRNTEQTNSYPYRSLLDCPQVHRIFLKELGDIRELPLGIALMVLTTVEKEQSPAIARELIAKTQEQILEPEVNRAIIEMIGTIMVYQFTNLSRQEILAMLGLELKDTRVYREAKEEGREQGREEGRQQEAINLVLRQLSRRCGTLSANLSQSIASLPVTVLEELSEALLDFTSLADLTTWLEQHS
jgi:predicted transposase/invertase (TIGR01784 family)